jgi:hypothetical protein
MAQGVGPEFNSPLQKKQKTKKKQERNASARSFGRSVFNFFEDLHTVFHNG